MTSRRLLSGAAAIIFTAAVLALVPGTAQAATAAPTPGPAPVIMNTDQATGGYLDLRGQAPDARLTDRGASTLAVTASVKCTQNASVKSCTVTVPGGYCGSSRQVGVGVTTKLKGGIVLNYPTTQAKRWSATSTAKSYMVVVGTTFSAAVTLNGTTADRPYATCSQ